jgi:hypothetical protein
VGEALRIVTEQVDRALSSLGNTLRDPEAKEGMNRVVKSLSKAVTATFSGVGEQLRTKRSPPGSN